MSLSRNFIAIGAVSTLLVFWLSISFWVEALAQRNGAVNLQHSTQPEMSLLLVTRALAQERRLANSLLSNGETNSNHISKLEEISIINDELLGQAIQEIERSRDNKLLFVQSRYGNQAIHNTYESLSIDRRKIDASIASIKSGLTGPIQDLKAGTRIELFDAYSRLIADIEKLRLRIRFLPKNNYYEVNTTEILKGEIYTLNESIERTSSLLEGFLIRSSANADVSLGNENLLLRLHQQSDQIDRSFLELTEIIEKGHSDSNTVKNLSELVSFYTLEYKIRGNVLVDSITNGALVDLTLVDWINTSKQIRTKINAIGDQAILQTLFDAKAIEHSATRNLIIDTFLVLLCIGMAIASLSVSKRVQYQANHDDLTDFPNRRKFGENLLDAVKSVDSSSKNLILMTVDLNGFKTINDTMGHAIGDKLLKQVADRIRRCTDDRMSVARMGGDEFSILFATHNADEAIGLAEKIQASLANTFNIDNGTVNVGASIGISQYPLDASTAEKLLVSSDFAMFHAKQGDGNKIQCYSSEMAERFENRLLIEKDLLVAIEEGQLVLNYQPQFNMSSNCVDAVEALVRWNHPTRGVLQPVEFIEIAEECGLIPALGRWVLDEACRQLAQWNRDIQWPLRVAVNVSVHQIMQPEFVQLVLDTIEKYQLDAQFLEIEITESAFMSNPDWVIGSLTTLRDKGIKIALDDFGTGYSSLSKLHDLPLSTLKIDKSFIDQLEGQSTESHSVTATIAKIAQEYGLETVAEGVESIDQLNRIAELGIEVVQGYYYSKPIASGELPTVIEAINSANNRNAA